MTLTSEAHRAGGPFRVNEEPRPKQEPEEALWHAAWLKAQALYPTKRHGMPEPPWHVHQFEEGGTQAWDRLQNIVPRRNGAISIYVHFPFCKTRCPFCDCHAAVMPRNNYDIVERYVSRLRHEVEQWRMIQDLARRPVTTVHLGGGTPHALNPTDFNLVVQTLRTTFVASAEAEWAIETNCRCLDDAHIEQLAHLGFSRIHIGVQTLNPRLRVLLGRRSPPDTVVERTRACLCRGWIVSADMLYGLPGQNTNDLVDDLRWLASEGIHGVSLYRLNHGSHNHRFMVRHGLAERGPSRVYADYLMFMEAAARLTEWGYRKNHFTHFALPRDRNLYSRHALRGEDLLGLGATADGVFGDYYYRHGGLDDYLISDDNQAPGIEGGSYFTAAERKARRLVTQMMSGEILDADIDGRQRRFLKDLLNAGLISWRARRHSWQLTDTGSWFIRECTAHAFSLYEQEGGSDATV